MATLLTSALVASAPVRLAIDLSFGPKMTLRERRSCAQQIIRVFGLNRKHASPLSLHLTSVAAARDEAPESLPAASHLHAWTTADAPLFALHDEAAAATWPAESLVWLSPDADVPLAAPLSREHVYVLGGLIDRSVLAGASLSRARSSGATVRRLPLREFAPRADVHPILSLPACWQILADVSGGASWEDAIASALPARFVSRRQHEEAQRREQALRLDSTISGTETSESETAESEI